MDELAAQIAADRMARNRQALIDDANRLCVFCKGGKVDRCSCGSDCGAAECGRALAVAACWLGNPRGLAPVPVFRARLA